ncbi:NusG domain II-containing protein [Treponema sp.]|uniref:NusG domain II-containing protein n=1 Tax=Treponema sp. TaxID=166 RepID=UPI00388FE454
MNLKILKLFRPLDFLILFLFIAVTAASFFFLKNSKDTKHMLVISADKKEYIYPLSKNREIQIESVLGQSIIVIQDGKAFFKSSPCTNKTCVQMGAVSEENDWAACLPNDVFIRIN